MDKGSSSTDRKAMADLIRRCMPKTAEIVRDKRRELGDAWVVECQARGMRGEPGWFFAREGCIAVGTPWPEDEGIAIWASGAMPPGATLVVLRPKESHGAH